MPTGSIRIFFNKIVLCLQVKSDAEPHKLGLDLIKQLIDLLSEFGYKGLKSKFAQIEIVESNSNESSTTTTTTDPTTEATFEQTQLGDFAIFDDYKPKRQCSGLVHSHDFNWNEYYSQTCPDYFSKTQSTQAISLRQILEDGVAVSRPGEPQFNYLINLNLGTFSCPETKWKIKLNKSDLQLKLQTLDKSNPSSLSWIPTENTRTTPVY